MLLVAMPFSYNPGNMTGILYNQYRNRLGKGIIFCGNTCSYLASFEKKKMVQCYFCSHSFLVQGMKFYIKSETASLLISLGDLVAN